ncbi:MAG TPA: leucine-rich repeat domain-containing protein [Levilinea sp.]|nr:leucine-rich repeat domain-containing protein [Levilinea sp.]
MFYRQEDNQDADWHELDRGPGYFHVPPGCEVRIRMKGANDHELRILVEELDGVTAITSLDLSENRKITDAGIVRLKSLLQLRDLNLSSCDITRITLDHLAELPNLQSLNLSYCNRLDDSAVKSLNALSSLAYLNLQACMQMTRAGVNRLQRRGLEIHR